MSIVQPAKEKTAMPNIRVEMFTGRTAEQKREYVDVVTRETCRILNCKPEDVNIILDEVARERWATGGKLWSER
jgi:4-oxalocrotonate tautomerase